MTVSREDHSELLEILDEEGRSGHGPSEAAAATIRSLDAALRAAAELDHRTSGEPDDLVQRLSWNGAFGPSGNTYERAAAEIERLRKPIGFMEAMKLCEQGLERWKAKEHNAKWWRRIDGTPIPNDLLVNIAEMLASLPDHQSAASHSQEEMIDSDWVASQAGSEASSGAASRLGDPTGHFDVPRPAPEQAAQGDVAETAAERGTP